jgi:acetyl-CoA C-acetyltransferase
MVSGVGMHMQKHAYGVWSTVPGPYVEAPAYAAEAEPLGIVGSPEGSATVATYSVLHGHDGGPERALLVCDVPEGGRSYGLLDGGVPAMLEAEADELVGRRVTLTPKDGINHAAL